MLCLRCMRSAFTPQKTLTPLRQAKQIPSRLTHPQQQQQRPLSLLTLPPTRPTLLSRPTQPTLEDTPTSSLRPLSQPSLSSLLQVRGAKRDTFNPSHRVRKRRHGFLARLRSRTGRMVLMRRKLKGRNTLSH